MKNPDERKIIKIFQKRFAKSGLADDVEVIKIGNSKFIIKSDMLVQSTDVPPRMKISEIARKSIVACVSDFSCKGVKPQFATISLAIPRGFTQKMINQLAEGFASASKEFGLKIVGGDTNQGKELIIEVSMFGGENKKMPLRGGAEIGDIIATSGPFGYSSSGLKIILNKYKTNPQFFRKCMGKVMRPTPRLRFGIQAAKYFSSSMDSSDGLSITLNDMSEQSKKRFVIFGFPTQYDVIEFSAKNRVDLKELVFCGGEEYEMVFTISPVNLRQIRKMAKKLQVPLFEIGYVARGKDVVLMEKFKPKKIKRCGWVHLRS
ncbi:MAG: thiamine-phosphate kinase [Nitrosotalea sp.]